MKSYVMDVYVDVAPKHKVWLIDFNPWIPESVDSLLFKWEDLLTIEEDLSAGI